MENSIYKKKTTQQSNVLEQTYFAVCPYLIEFQNSIDFIFTINFQKDSQIIGQLSQLILPSTQNSKVSVQPQKNIMFFRVSKDKKSHYKWTLYRRNQKGKQQIMEIIKVELKEIIDNFIKLQLVQKESIKTKSKLQPLNQTNKIFKQSNFVKTGILLHYMFFIGANQNKIVDAVKKFKLQQKLPIFQKTFNKIVNQKVKEQKQQMNSMKKQQEPFSQNQQIQQMKQEKTYKQNFILQKKQNKRLKQTIPQNTFITDQPNDKVQLKKQHFIQQQSSIKKQSYLSKYNKQSKTQPIFQAFYFPEQSKQNQLKKSISQLAKKVNQNQSIKYSQIEISKPLSNKLNKLKTKDSFKNLKLQFEDIIKNQQGNDYLQVNASKQQKNDLEKHQTQNLALTFPSKNLNGSQISVKNNEISGTSYLRLDDIILNDKRISVSDKSSWMHTSKSKTDSKQNFQNKSKEANVNFEINKQENYSEDLMINSKMPSLIEQKITLSSKSPLNNKKTLLKRGTSIDNKKVYDQISINSHKPKTLGQEQINQSINDQLSKMNTKNDFSFNFQNKKQDNRRDNKYTINIPSMIEEDIQLSRSFQPDNSRGNSLSEKKDSIQQQEWGKGIQQINSEIKQLDRNWIDMKVLDIQKYFVPKLKPVIKKIQKNQWTKQKYNKVKPFLSTKKIIIAILLLIFFLGFTIFWNLKKSMKNTDYKRKNWKKQTKSRKKQSLISKYLSY